MPVILCHGLTYNALFWDLDPSCSLAEYLSAQGLDVWVVSLRGCGLSQKWVWKVEDTPAALVGIAMRRLTHGKLPPTGFATIDPRYANWTLDHHITYDVPALVDLVRRRTGAPQVAWVGHSMGGIVAIGHLARFGNPGIGRLVTVGSQVTMPPGRLPVEFCRETILSRQKQLAGQLNGKELIEQTRTGIHNLFFNVQNVDDNLRRPLGRLGHRHPRHRPDGAIHGAGDKGVLLDASQQVQLRAAPREDQGPHLHQLRRPGPVRAPAVQQYLFDHVGSAEKTLLFFGQAQGLAVDAGHDDALVGLNSRDQVYPAIARWLAPGS